MKCANCGCRWLRAHGYMERISCLLQNAAKTLTKGTSFIQPELLAQEIELGRDPFINNSLFLFLGNMYIGGIELPVALTAHTRVTNSPFSTDTRLPICFLPLTSMTRPGEWTVLIPFPSALYTLFAVKLVLLQYFIQIDKKPFGSDGIKCRSLAEWSRFRLSHG